MRVTRNFFSIGKLVKEGRIKTGISQHVLARKLDFKTGQFISNVERGLCTVPFEKVETLAFELDIPPREFIEAITKDFRSNLRHAVNGSM